MNIYNFFKYLKNENSERCIIIKNGCFYQSFNEDSLILNGIFNFKIVKLNNNFKKIGFPMSNLDKVTKKLDELKINYTIINDSLNITNKEYENNEYKKYYSKVKSKYELDVKLDNIIEKIKQQVEIDKTILDKIENILK